MTAPKPIWWLLGIALGTVPIVGGGFVLVELQASSALKNIDTGISGSLQSLNSTIASAQPIIAKAGDTLDTINRPCGGGHPCGTLANLDKMIVHSGDITVAAQQQVIQSGFLIASTTKSIDTATVHLDATLDSYTRLGAQATTTLQSIDPVMDGLVPLEDSARTTVKDFDALVTSQDIKTLTASLASTSTEVSGIAKDVHKEADVLTAPRQHHWYTPIATAGSVVSHWFPPLF